MGGSQWEAQIKIEMIYELLLKVLNPKKKFYIVII